MRRFGIAVGCAAYALIALAIMLISALAFAAGVPPDPAVDPTLDWIVKVALALLAIAAPIQLWLGKALLSTLKAHGEHLARHDVQLAELIESKVYRGQCEERCEQRQRDCPARQAVLARATAAAFPAGLPATPASPGPPSAKG
ncbi:MAG: hypothetical protein FJ125_17075 [Deltaproteobacteria bacterium]|nr:hypothetical protein [Deltaproteobacteria bacterium]